MGRDDGNGGEPITNQIDFSLLSIRGEGEGKGKVRVIISHFDPAKVEVN